MPVSPDIVERLLNEGFPNGKISVEDQKGNGDYYMIKVEDIGFAGKTRVAQHKMVHNALQTVISDIHAISVQTSVPKE